MDEGGITEISIPTSMPGVSQYQWTAIHISRVEGPLMRAMRGERASAGSSTSRGAKKPQSRGINAEVRRANQSFLELYATGTGRVFGQDARRVGVPGDGAGPADQMPSTRRRRGPRHAAIYPGCYFRSHVTAIHI